MTKRNGRKLSPAERGRLGGLARAKHLTSAQRTASGRKAGQANARRLAQLHAMEAALLRARLGSEGRADA